MKIAVLMSTYNGHKYLDEQLKSIAEQTVAEKTVLYIRDDGSTDNTLEIIDKWKTKVNIVLFKGSNAGPAMSFWELMMNPDIQADYYAFADQDDIWDADKLECGIKQLHGKTNLYACNCRIIDENSKTVKKKRLSVEPNINLQRLFISGCTQGCSMVFTENLCKYLRKLYIQCVPMHDIVLMLYAKFYGEIYWDAEPHFGYRVHSNNVVAKNNKSIYKRIKTTIWNWENSKRNSMSDVANEMLKNISNLSKEEKKYLKYISDYKKHRIWLIKNAGNSGADVSSTRSFRCRILLGIF